MEIEVPMPSPAVEFNFDSTCTSPYVSAPSSPHRYGNFFFSVPTSPTRASSFYRDYSLNNPAATNAADGPLCTIPFDWEDKPGIAKRKDPTNTINDHDEDTDFAFDFSGHLERPSLSAEELFDGGKIKPLKPLKPPPRLQYSESGVGDSPRSPKSPKRMFREALSPRHKKEDFDPFSEAMKQTSREQTQQNLENTQRGRERTHNSSNSRHKGSRSLSPLRASDELFEEENNQKSSSSSSSTWYSKLKLKDLLLFRSASEGSTTRKNPLKKYAMIKKSNNEDVKNSSFRSTDSRSSVGSSSRRRRMRLSAHELHYTANRAVAEEMRRKTFLPYNQGLLGCLGIHHGVLRRE